MRMRGLLHATVRVRRACIHSYIHIWALYHVTMYTMLRLLGQTRMYTFLYPYMGIVSRDNVHNVKITAQVRRACIYPYMGIVSPYNVLNVKVTARVRRAYTYSDVHIR